MGEAERAGTKGGREEGERETSSPIEISGYATEQLCGNFTHDRRLGSLTVMTLDLQSRGRWFSPRCGRYTWMGDCLRISVGLL